MKLWERDLKSMEFQISRKLIQYDKNDKGYYRWYNRNMPKIRERLGVGNTTILFRRATFIACTELGQMSEKEFNKRYHLFDKDWRKKEIKISSS